MAINAFCEEDLEALCSLFLQIFEHRFSC